MAGVTPNPFSMPQPGDANPTEPPGVQHAVTYLLTYLHTYLAS